jgi:hypothetical protein
MFLHRTAAIYSLLLAMLTMGCSTFSREWKAAAAHPSPADDISGCWEGSWSSGKNGHNGSLRCLMTKLDDAHYLTRYKATYWKLLRFGYAVKMRVEKPSPDNFKSEGEADLGWWGGGVYRYEGQITPINFYSTYKSDYDQGTFRMKRPN